MASLATYIDRIEAELGILDKNSSDANSQKRQKLIDAVKDLPIDEINGAQLDAFVKHAANIFHALLQQQYAIDDQTRAVVQEGLRQSRPDVDYVKYVKTLFATVSQPISAHPSDSSSSISSLNSSGHSPNSSVKNISTLLPAQLIEALEKELALKQQVDEEVASDVNQSIISDENTSNVAKLLRCGTLQDFQKELADLTAAQPMQDFVNSLAERDVNQLLNNIAGKLAEIDYSKDESVKHFAQVHEFISAVNDNSSNSIANKILALLILSHYSIRRGLAKNKANSLTEARRYFAEADALITTQKESMSAAVNDLHKSFLVFAKLDPLYRKAIKPTAKDIFNLVSDQAKTSTEEEFKYFANVVYSFYQPIYGQHYLGLLEWIQDQPSNISSKQKNDKHREVLLGLILAKDSPENIEKLRKNLQSKYHISLTVLASLDAVNAELLCQGMAASVLKSLLKYVLAKGSDEQQKQMIAAMTKLVSKGTEIKLTEDEERDLFVVHTHDLMADLDLKEQQQQLRDIATYVVLGAVSLERFKQFINGNNFSIEDISKAFEQLKDLKAKTVKFKLLLWLVAQKDSSAWDAFKVAVKIECSDDPLNLVEIFSNMEPSSNKNRLGIALLQAEGLNSEQLQKIYNAISDKIPAITSLTRGPAFNITKIRITDAWEVFSDIKMGPVAVVQVVAGLLLSRNDVVTLEDKQLLELFESVSTDSLEHYAQALQRKFVEYLLEKERSESTTSRQNLIKTAIVDVLWQVYLDANTTNDDKKYLFAIINKIGLNSRRANRLFENCSAIQKGECFSAFMSIDPTLANDLFNQNGFSQNYPTIATAVISDPTRIIQYSANNLDKLLIARKQDALSAFRTLLGGRKISSADSVTLEAAIKKFGYSLLRQAKSLGLNASVCFGIFVELSTNPENKTTTAKLLVDTGFIPSLSLDQVEEIYDVVDQEAQGKIKAAIATAENLKNFLRLQRFHLVLELFDDSAVIGECENLMNSDRVSFDAFFNFLFERREQTKNKRIIATLIKANPQAFIGQFSRWSDFLSEVEIAQCLGRALDDNERFSSDDAKKILEQKNLVEQLNEKQIHSLIRSSRLTSEFVFLANQYREAAQGSKIRVGIILAIEQEGWAGFIKEFNLPERAGLVTLSLGKEPTNFFSALSTIIPLLKAPSIVEIFQSSWIKRELNSSYIANILFDDIFNLEHEADITTFFRNIFQECKSLAEIPVPLIKALQSLNEKRETFSRVHHALEAVEKKPLYFGGFVEQIRLVGEQRDRHLVDLYMQNSDITIIDRNAARYALLEGKIGVSDPKLTEFFVRADFDPIVLDDNRLNDSPIKSNLALYLLKTKLSHASMPLEKAFKLLNPEQISQLIISHFAANNGKVVELNQQRLLFLILQRYITEADLASLSEQEALRLFQLLDDQNKVTFLSNYIELAPWLKRFVTTQLKAKPNRTVSVYKSRASEYLSASLAYDLLQQSTQDNPLDPIISDVSIRSLQKDRRNFLARSARLLRAAYTPNGTLLVETFFNGLCGQVRDRVSENPPQKSYLEALQEMYQLRLDDKSYVEELSISDLIIFLSKMTDHNERSTWARVILTTDSRRSQFTTEIHEVFLGLLTSNDLNEIASSELSEIIIPALKEDITRLVLEHRTAVTSGTSLPLQDKIIGLLVSRFGGWGVDFNQVSYPDVIGYFTRNWSLTSTESFARQLREKNPRSELYQELVENIRDNLDKLINQANQNEQLWPHLIGLLSDLAVSDDYRETLFKRIIEYILENPQNSIRVKQQLFNSVLNNPSSLLAKTLFKDSNSNDEFISLRNEFINQKLTTTNQTQPQTLFSSIGLEFLVHISPAVITQYLGTLGFPPSTLQGKIHNLLQSNLNTTQKAGCCRLLLCAFELADPKRRANFINRDMTQNVPAETIFAELSSLNPEQRLMGISDADGRIFNVPIFEKLVAETNYRQAIVSTLNSDATNPHKPTLVEEARRCWFNKPAFTDVFRESYRAQLNRAPESSVMHSPAVFETLEPQQQKAVAWASKVVSTKGFGDSLRLYVNAITTHPNDKDSLLAALNAPEAEATLSRGQKWARRFATYIPSVSNWFIKSIEVDLAAPPVIETMNPNLDQPNGLNGRPGSNAAAALTPAGSTVPTNARSYPDLRVVGTGLSDTHGQLSQSMPDLTLIRDGLAQTAIIASGTAANAGQNRKVVRNDNNNETPSSSTFSRRYGRGPSSS